ncbi:hypothetical protein A5893_02455 [Pedobacter psychrophilus]|uniref:Beta-xylanase n=1 Tax=Pedobacter psychrophilus TaxID=1826909 RepID=A0A179DLT3_9SPHI|nr:endo-1,4-beta-xylanase [Pedobacter psychrophilus]OAQ42001.1 hypothetical protein A5893_02455 [Pedobacter psychrophilus]
MKKVLKWTIVLSIFFLNSAYAQIVGGEALLSDGIFSLKPFGFDDADGIVKKVAVSGQSFNQALEINTFNNSKIGMGLNAKINTNFKKGDVLLISFKTKNIESKRETGESFIEVRFDQLKNHNYVWPSHLERGVSFGKEWTETNIPFIMEKDAKAEDVLFVMKFDSYPEKFQISQLKFINYGPNVSLNNLPRSVIKYDGDEVDAKWRKDADERIDKYRKGDLAITVLDNNGKLVSGAEVEVKMKRIAYNWGTATNSKTLLDTVNRNSKIYRDTLLKYFNQVVFENEMKGPNWVSNNHEQTKEGLLWLKKHQIPVRGHVMVWPSWEHSAHLKAFKNDTAGLKRSIFNLIDDETAEMKNQFAEWDVVNEPYAHHDFLNLLGRYEMVEWFKRAAKGNTGAKLFLNDYTMFHGKGPNSASEKFYDNVKYLLANHAPIDAVGEQGHIGGTPPGIPEVIERLEYFSQLGLPIQISEFDINSNDDEFKAKYMGDFMKAVFSQPLTIGFVQWGFWEGMHWFPVAALWDKDWNLRANGKVFTQLVNKTWNTNVSGTTDKAGVFKTRGFNGSYDITVKYNGKEVTNKAVLTSKDLSVNVAIP